MDSQQEAMSTRDRLIYMVNQIARNLESQGKEAAAIMVADHIRSFWSPAMRGAILELAEDRPDAFTPIALAAVARIAGA